MAVSNPSEPLVLVVTWTRGTKHLDGELVTFFPVKRDRYICGFCGDSMTSTKLREHYMGCRAEAGMW